MAHINDFISRSLINKTSSNIDIFDEMDFLYQLMEEEDFFSTPEPYATPPPPHNTPIPRPSTPSVSEISINIPRLSTEGIIDSDFLSKPLVATTVAEEFLKQPSKSSKDAYYIWKQARLPKYATKSLIESELTKWAIQNASIDSNLSSDSKDWNITWKSQSDTTCTSKFSTFIKWVECACNRNYNS